MRIVHTADIHLRDVQFGRADRGEDFTNAVFEVIEVANDVGAKFILASGDIFNRKRPSSKNIDDLIKIDRKLDFFDIEMITIPGDHDMCTPSWIETLSSEDGITNITDITNKLITLEDGKELLTVFGAPTPCMHPDTFRGECRDWPEADVLMYHGPVKEFTAYPPDPNNPVNDVCIDDLPTERYRLMALGDLHARNYKRSDGCIIGYPGPTEYCSANEKPEKSVEVFEFRGDVVGSTTHALNTRKVIQCRVKTEEDMEDLLVLAAGNKSKNPIVHVWHSVDVADVFTRLCHVLDPRKAIIRVNAVPNARLESMYNEGAAYACSLSSKRPSDFVSNFAPANSDIHHLMVDLCNPETEAGPLLTKYIETNLNQDEF